MTLIPPWGRGLVFASAMTVVNLVVLVLLNQTSPPPPPPDAAAKKIPIAFPSASPSKPRPVPLPASIPPPSQIALTAAAPLSPSTSMRSPVPALPTLVGSLPRFGTGTFGVAVSETATSVAPTASAQTGPTTAARPVKRPPPKYPRAAARRGLEGEVVVRVRVNARGVVTDASVVRATPKGVFDAAALSAARRYRFAPATENGVAVETTLEQRLLFRVPK